MKDLLKKRDELFHELCRQMKKRGIPDRLQGGLARFLIGGIRPGVFLTAVLENDLRVAVLTADRESRAGLRSIVRFVWESAPAPAWGSPENVAAWISMSDESRSFALLHAVDGDVT